jgi:NAD+ kinase
MKRFVVTSKGDDKSNAIKTILDQYLSDFDLVMDEEAPDLVITVGGDGTFLHAVHQYFHRLKETAFIGVHTGHLGFYADWLPDEIEKLVIEISKEKFDIVEYPLLEVKVFKKGAENYERYLALNEATVRKIEGSVVMDININGELFERFRGDGLCMSTPSGSTAYNKALGGAIIHPSLSTMQLTEMSSINNRVYRTIGSPLIFPSHHVVQFKPVNEAQSFLMTIDHLTKSVDHVNLLECTVAKEKIKFARFRTFPFWKRVHDSFISDER